MAGNPKSIFKSVKASPHAPLRYNFTAPVDTRTSALWPQAVRSFERASRFSSRWAAGCLLEGKHLLLIGRLAQDRVKAVVPPPFHPSCVFEEIFVYIRLMQSGASNGLTDAALPQAPRGVCVLAAVPRCLLPLPRKE